MLTGKMVRVRQGRDKITASYIDPTSHSWLEIGEQLLDLFRGQEGRTRGELEEDIEAAFGDDPRQLVHQGLAKLLEDRCEFEVDASQPPEEIRDAVFRIAAAQRASLAPNAHFDRQAALEAVAKTKEITLDQIEHSLFADLRSEQRLIKFNDLSPRRLLDRYNVALAQAILLRSTRVHVLIRNESPQRYRALLRQVKFHRLICEVQSAGPKSYHFHLDGPLSLFSATQKYGLQMAMFLPSVLHCVDFELRAELRWGPQKKPRTFQITPSDALVSHTPDSGTFVPPEMKMFAELFAKRQPDWELIEETEVFPLGDSWWVPDFRLKRRADGKTLRLEVLGFWRRSSAEKHLDRLRRHVKEPFLLAVSDTLHIDEADLESLPAGIVRFKQLPLPDEIVRRAEALLTAKNSGPSSPG